MTPTITDIQRAVADHYGIKVSDMTGPSRLRRDTHPRKVAMYLSRMFTKASLTEISRRFNRTDHTTVRHAVETAEDWIRYDPNFAADVNACMKDVRALTVEPVFFSRYRSRNQFTTRRTQ